MSVWAIIVAGGNSMRMGGNLNKTLLVIDGEAVIRQSVQRFQAVCEGVVVVRKATEAEAFQRALHGLPVVFANGGDTRHESVDNGLKRVPDDCDIVLVHDGARPLVTKTLIERVLDGARQYGAAIPAVAVTDSIKKVQGGVVTDSIDRNVLAAVQTPQGFRCDLLRRAYGQGDMHETDDSALVAALGVSVYVVEGERSNIKLTTKEDVSLIRTNLSGDHQMRVGYGYDVHRLVPDRKLVLCGVNVPHTLGLLGHSDADAALHALCDALLGASALGDIGQLFPDSDDAYLGIDSVILLRKTVEKLAENGMRPYNADITIAAQKPKLLPYVKQMRDKVAEILGIAPQYISVKATTTERLGFEGREEGISAHAVVTVVPIW